MKEINDIIKAYEEAQTRQKQTALATVVHVNGSSYRRPGARMLITEDGELTGAISGGCLEGDALRKSLLAIMEQKTKLVTYDTNDEDDAKMGLGLGCNGIIQVLIESIDPSNPNNPIQLLKKATAIRQNASLITLFSLQDKRAPQPGLCLLVTDDQYILGNAAFLKETQLEETLIANAKQVIALKKSAFKNYISQDQNITAFIEYIKPPVSLVIIGAGNDVLPLVNMSGIMGWQTTIIDGRPHYSSGERFPGSCQVLTTKPEGLLQQIPIDDQTAFVLMTHNYNYDLAMLRVLLQQDLAYIGMLGPKKKLTRMLDELRAEGQALTPLQLSIIHSPVGLDIGAETPEEIALSIMAEIKAVLARRYPFFLTEKNDVIHARSATLIEEIRLNSL
ncbi:XdhC family protein [Chitinophagaceae bacterium LB-8]|uniref:XdhC family protein n=1 Tax=Paraflavisolibacter caeni TaxID=2982496 RepID=A0A9X2XX98_9BACT|nr:XdhC family protein [Paraflavisolibacter caeni]MCU7550377.1 XdhC family protein [Paraflavisolibacter caeni]